MATWTYRAQEVLEDELSAGTFASPLGARNTMVGRMHWPAAFTRTFRLRYSVVTSATATAMLAFYTARRGAFEAFDWVNPNDSKPYLVRFGPGMTIETFIPGLARGLDVQLTVVAS